MPDKTGSKQDQQLYALWIALDESVRATERLLARMDKSSAKKQQSADVYLAELWAASERGDVLLGIANRTADRKRLTRAACECARMLWDRLPEREASTRAAVVKAEAWTNDKAKRDDVAAAILTAYSDTWGNDVYDLGSIERLACDASIYASAVVLGRSVGFDDSYDRSGRRWVHALKDGTELTADNVGMSVRHACAGRFPEDVNAQAAWNQVHDEARSKLAKIVRAHVSAPTVEQLRKAAMEEAKRVGD